MPYHPTSHLNAHPLSFSRAEENDRKKKEATAAGIRGLVCKRTVRGRGEACARVDAVDSCGSQ
jgi:hypothetical protein